MTNEKERALYRLRITMAGEYTVGATMFATQTMLAECIGLGSDTIDQADKIAEMVAEEIKREIRTNWGHLSEIRRQIRAQPLNARGRA